MVVEKYKSLLLVCLLAHISEQNGRSDISPSGTALLSCNHTSIKKIREGNEFRSIISLKIKIEIRSRFSGITNTDIQSELVITKTKKNTQL